MSRFVTANELAKLSLMILKIDERIRKLEELHDTEDDNEEMGFDPGEETEQSDGQRDG